MSKRRKTKQQKMITDLQRKLQTTTPTLSQTADYPSQMVHTPTYTYTAPKTHTQKPTATFITTNPYVLKDLQKTILLTGAIVLSQVFLFYLLQRHVLVIPGMTY